MFNENMLKKYENHYLKKNKKTEINNIVYFRWNTVNRFFYFEKFDFEHKFGIYFITFCFNFLICFLIKDLFYWIRPTELNKNKFDKFLYQLIAEIFWFKFMLLCHLQNLTKNQIYLNVVTNEVLYFFLKIIKRSHLLICWLECNSFNIFG